MTEVQKKQLDQAINPPEAEDKSVLLALSGGVDSAVAALRLKQAGYEVHACYMQLWTEGGQAGQTSPELERARTLARDLDLPFMALDLRDLFKREIVDYFIAAYAQGQTPNPCIVCNQKLKFRLPHLATLQGFTPCRYFATGHYARVCRQADGSYSLHLAKDLSKDQSYMLYHLKQDDLSRLILPLGESSKQEIKAEAARHGFAAAKVKESQDICFICDNDHHRFLAQYSPDLEPGDFISPDGQVLGRHKGLGHYTVGQQKRLGIALGQRMCVAEIRPDTNQIVLLPANQFKQRSALVSQLSFIQDKPPKPGSQIEVCVRYRGRRVPAQLLPAPGQDPNSFSTGGSLIVSRPDGLPAISPGQACVFYQSDQVLGGGIWTGAYY